jgi:hypothetical protein
MVSRWESGEPLCSGTSAVGPWQGDGVLILGRPGRAHSIWLFWDDRGFAGWYINLEEP